MPRKFLKLLLVVAYVMFFFLPAVTHAADGDGTEEFKNEWNGVLDDYNQEGQKKKDTKDEEVKPKNKKQGGVTLLSKKYPSNNYFPIVYADDSWWPFSSEKVSKGINGASTGIFALNKQLSEVVDASLDKFLSMDVINKVQDTVTEASDNMWQTVKKHFAPILLVIAVTQIFIYYVAESNGSKAGKTSLKLLLIIIVAFVWVSNSGYFLTVLNHWSSQAQGYMMNAGTTLTDDVEEIKKGEEVQGSAALLRNSFFQMTVRRPYLVMNYGTTDEEKIQEKAEKGENRIEDMLALKTNKEGSKEREELSKDEVDKKGNNYMGQSGVWSKFGISLLSIAFTAFLGVPLFLLAFFNVLIQFVALMIAFILPIAFLVSLLPSFANSGWHSLGRLISTFMMKMFISILILFTFMIFNIVDVLIPPDNVGMYYLNMSLAAILIVFMIMKRDKIVAFITAGRVAGMTGQIPGSMTNGARRMGGMGRTAGSHATTTGLAAGGIGAATASKMRSGAAKGKDMLQNRAQQRRSQQGDDQQGQDGKQQGKGQEGTQDGDVVDFNRYRQNQERTPQGNQDNEGTSDSGSEGNQDSPPNGTDGEGKTKEQSNDTQQGIADQGGTAHTQNKMHKRGEMRSRPKGDTGSGHEQPKRKKTELDNNPQTSGNVTPPKKPTQWEADKQVENQKHKGEPNPGRISRKNRTPQDGRPSVRQEGNQSKQQKQLQQDNQSQQKQYQAGQQKQQKKAAKQERKEQRQNLHWTKKENKDTTLDKASRKANEKRKEMVQHRRRRRGRR